MVSAFICVECFSKNVMLNISMFFAGMGLSILIGGVLLGSEGLAISVLGGIYSTMG